MQVTWTMCSPNCSCVGAAPTVVAAISAQKKAFPTSSVNVGRSFACVYCFQINTSASRNRHRSDQGLGHNQSTLLINRKNDDDQSKKPCPSISLPSNALIVTSNNAINVNKSSSSSIIDSVLFASQSWLLSFIAVRIQILKALSPLLTAHTLLFLITSICFWNAAFAPGEFVHDDLVAVVRNPDVLGENGSFQLFLNDFWGEPMHHQTSHKSYRPFTVLTFRYV